MWSRISRNPSPMATTHSPHVQVQNLPHNVDPLISGPRTPYAAADQLLAEPDVAEMQSSAPAACLLLHHLIVCRLLCGLIVGHPLHHLVVDGRLWFWPPSGSGHLRHLLLPWCSRWPLGASRGRSCRHGSPAGNYYLQGKTSLNHCMHN